MIPAVAPPLEVQIPYLYKLTCALELPIPTALVRDSYLGAMTILSSEGVLLSANQVVAILVAASDQESLVALHDAWIPYFWEDSDRGDKAQKLFSPIIMLASDLPEVRQRIHALSTSPEHPRATRYGLAKFCLSNYEYSLSLEQSYAQSSVPDAIELTFMMPQMYVVLVEGVLSPLRGGPAARCFYRKAVELANEHPTEVSAYIAEQIAAAGGNNASVSLFVSLAQHLGLSVPTVGN